MLLLELISHLKVFIFAGLANLALEGAKLGFELGDDGSELTRTHGWLGLSHIGGLFGLKRDVMGG